jgi:SAM-dependent methyltransferase
VTDQVAALWNRRARTLEPPLPPPRQLLLAAGDEEAQLGAVRDGVRAQAGTRQGELLGAMSPEEIRALCLADDAPLPASGDREGYYRDQDLVYWLAGLGDALLLRSLGAAPGCALLDFGCSSGRVLRHLSRVIPGVAAYGVDLGVHNVQWARDHLADELIVAQNSTQPSLPFEDRSLDIVFAGSVFTHIAEYEEAWLLELRRVLKPGGWALITFHPARIWPMLAEPDRHVLRGVTEVRHRMDPPGAEPVTDADIAGEMPAERVVFTNLTWPVNNTNVIHHHAWIKRRWGRVMMLERILERAHGGHQDAALLRRS